MNQKIKPPSKKELFDDDDGSDSSSSGSESDDSASSGDSSSSQSAPKLTVNKKFAKEYQDRKQREELRQIAQQRRENGLGSDDEADDSSSDEEEDEEGRLLTDSVNLQFLKTIQALKNKDSSIYDPKSRFFEELDEESDGNVGETKRKPKKFKDILRDQILEDMEKENDDDSSKGDIDKTTALSKSKFAYDDQQEELRKAFLKETNDETSDHEEDWMVMKSKTKPLKDADKEAAIREEFKVLEKLTTKKKANATFADPRGEVKDGERFLIDFMKNKKWIDKEEYGNQDEASRDAVEQGEESSIEDLDRADEFEAQYNFRYEQAAAETATSGATLSIQTFARGQTMNTLRRQDATRKDKRQARKERKEAERKAKEEQLKRLKNAKRQEVEKKLSQVKAVIGAVDEKAIDEAAIMKMLEGDYDPEQFEKAMQEAYGDDFYQKEDPEWKSDIDVRQALQNDEEVNDVVGQDDAAGGLYDDGMDAHDEEAETSNWEDDEDNEEYIGGDEEMESELEKKLKNKLQEELYKLDYEDIVAGMPTRFKYRQVEPNDYGLTTHEILLARDTTLKQYVSLKKLAPYNEAGEHFVGSKKRRRFREMLKQDLMEEMGSEDPPQQEKEQEDGEENGGEIKKKRRRLKKGKKNSQGTQNESKEKPDDLESSTKPANDISDHAKPQKRRRKKGTKDEEEGQNTNDSTLLSSEKPGDTSKTTSGPDSHMTRSDEHEVKKKKKTKRSKKAVASLPKSRLASYGL